MPDNLPNCPKCSSDNSSYIFCNKCTTYYCMHCNVHYYVENDKVIENHNPHCDNKSDDDLSSIDLSDYDN